VLLPEFADAACQQTLDHHCIMRGIHADTQEAPSGFRGGKLVNFGANKNQTEIHFPDFVDIDGTKTRAVPERGLVRFPSEERNPAKKTSVVRRRRVNPRAVLHPMFSGGPERASS
jgi:hypothetical protein